MYFCQVFNKITERNSYEPFLELIYHQQQLFSNALLRTWIKTNGRPLESSRAEMAAYGLLDFWPCKRKQILSLRAPISTSTHWKNSYLVPETKTFSRMFHNFESGWQYLGIYSSIRSWGCFSCGDHEKFIYVFTMVSRRTGFEPVLI